MPSILKLLFQFEAYSVRGCDVWRRNPLKQNQLISSTIMETAGAVVLSGISYVEENKNKLTATMERLNTRKFDVLSRISSELRSGKKLKMEAQLWLDNVEKKKEEARDLENKAAEGGIMDRVSLGRSLCMKIEEAERLYEMGSFADGLVFDETPCENIGIADLSEKTRRKKKKKKTTIKNNGSKISIIGQGGIGKTRIKNKGQTNFKFGNIQI